MSEIALTIDEKHVTATPGTSLLQAALDAGIEIPHLCYDQRLQPYGACRMCLVEIDGTPEPVTACTAEAESGMVVRTQTDRLREIRRTLVELMLYDHPRDCLTCANTGTCNLQDLAYKLGIEDFQPIPREPRTIVEDPGNSVIFRDPAKCILCGKCVRICGEHQMVGALDFADRGIDTQVIPARGGLAWDTECELCGQCVDVCPAGALMVRRAMEKGREKDFDKVRTVCPYCGVGCNVELNVLDDEVVMVTANPDTLPNYGNLCVKGRFQFEFIDSPDRLKQPLIRRGGELVEASWDEALDQVASRLQAIHEKHGPGSVGFVSSCRCTNEENYLMQKLARAVFATHDIDQCARTCHAPTVAGLAMSFGSGAMTNSIREIQNCDVLLVIGSNTTEAHPVIALEMKRAFARGARIVVVDPRRIGMTQYACLHLPVQPGTDVALLNCMMNVIIQEGWANEEFITERTEGYEELRETVGKYGLDEVAELCAVPAEDIREAARIYATGEKSAIFYTLGLTEHICGTDNVRSCANLAMLTGHIGRESTGVNPLRGQNNVQGACDMGASPNVYPGYQKVTDQDVARKFSEAYGVELPAENGMTTTAMLDAAREGRLKALYVMGEDIIMSEPSMASTREACENLELLVVQDIFMCETAKMADVILPATSYAEKDGTFTNTERRVQRVRQAVSPRGNCRPDWRILTDIANRLGQSWRYEHPSEIWDELAALTPIFAGMSYDRIDEVGLQWPCPSADHPGTGFLHEGQFTRGRGKFWPLAYRPPAEEPDDEYPFYLTTGRTLYHYNVGTMSTRSASAMERQPKAFVEISPADAEGLALRNGDDVRVATRRGELTVAAWVTDRVRPGRLWMPFHFVEQAANVLTIDAFDDVSETAEYKVCAARVTRA